MGVLRRFRMLFWPLLAGCAGSLPEPSTTRHSTEAFQPVPYPPPAALAETVPPRPRRGDPVWIDGEWVFHGRSFVWQRGGWVEPPKDALFAPGQEKYELDGRLLLAPGTWYGPSGNSLPRPEVMVPATTPPNEVTAESQTGR
jgi:hypothetical protein